MFIQAYIISPLKTIKNHIVWFFQRRTRGFDDRELWDMDFYFYKWLVARLKRFVKKTVGYPDSYKAMSSWQKDVTNRIIQLEWIIQYTGDEFEFPYVENYLSAKQIEELKANMSNGQIKYVAYYKCVANFNKWFYKNVNNLWY